MISQLAVWGKFPGYNVRRKDLGEAQKSLSELRRNCENGKTRQLKFVIKEVSIILKGFKFAFDFNEIKLITNNRKTCEQVPNIWGKNSILLNSL